MQTDIVKRVEAILKEHNAFGATFYEIGEHTPVAGIRNGLKLFKDNQCDVIVSVGGGSPIDGSKAMLYNLQQETGGPTLHQIAIPTTLSAAEYTVGIQLPNVYIFSKIIVFFRMVPVLPTMRVLKSLLARWNWHLLGLSSMQS